ncbi:MAG: phage tail protein [Sphingomicrobium sp.]
MNVNGSRFHLLFGRDNWAGCLARNGAKSLGDAWRLNAEDPDSKLPSLDEESRALRLAKRVAEIPDTPGERHFRPSDHRPAAADRNSNLYWIADGRDQLLVRSVGSRKISALWPLETPRPISRTFVDYEDPPGEPLAIRSLAVTSDDYLVGAVDYAGTRTELIRFDLVGGGAPERFQLPSGISVDDLAPSSGGGVWLLDRTAGRLLLVNRDMHLATRPVDGDASVFAPDGEEPATCAREELFAVSTAAIPEPVALAALPDGSVAVLDAPGQAPAGIFILEKSATALALLLRFDFVAFCMAVEGDGTELALMVGEVGGNRARRIRVERSGERWTALASADTLPLRRFGGRALVGIAGAVHYDSGPEPLWVRVMELPHRAFAAEATFLTPIFDSKEPQCLWDRLRLEACIPGGASIEVEARGSDDAALLGGSAEVGWMPQPPLCLSRRPADLSAGISPTPSQSLVAGDGSWEVLLQDVGGRYCQLRLKLAGNGQVSPHIRALRLWYPRFSYVEHFLPAVYRAEAPPGSFLERFLANFEGVATALEDRIATAETLFDPRTVPNGMLDWLASWFDIAIDRQWDEKRRRLFLAKAARYFAWRGTVGALQLALKLALSDEIEDSDFDLDAPKAVRPGGIQIAESFQRMPNLRRFDPHPAGTGAGLPREHGLEALWTPQEGSAGLWARFVPDEKDRPPSSTPFPLFAESDAPRWAAFCQAQFGFVPGAGARERERWHAFQRSAGADKPIDVPGVTMSEPDRARWSAYLALHSRERQLWQHFLLSRYRSIERLQDAWAEAWGKFSDIPLPDHLAAAEAAARDWLIFEGQRLPMEVGAHRFSVLLPRSRVDVSPEEEADLLARARHVVELEKPAHTRFDIRFYWAMNRIGEARIGLDTGIGQGSRAPELIPGAILGRAYVGSAFVASPAPTSRGRRRLAC